MALNDEEVALGTEVRLPAVWLCCAALSFAEATLVHRKYVFIHPFGGVSQAGSKMRVEYRPWRPFERMSECDKAREVLISPPKVCTEAKPRRPVNVTRVDSPPLMSRIVPAVTCAGSL